MIEKLLDHLVSEKMDMKEYMELAEMTDDTHLKDMLNKLAYAECEHYKMIRDYLSSKINTE